jgi:hypothetical protein
MADFFPPGSYPKAFARHRKVVTGPNLFLGTGLVFQHLHRLDVGERIIMPLADDGTGGGVLGATDYRMTVEVPSADRLRQGEVEHWFDLN